MTEKIGQRTFNDVADQVVHERRRRKIVIASGTLLFGILALWCVNATIIIDTDWQRMGSIGDMLRVIGRYVGFDVPLFKQLLQPALETLLIAFLGTLIGVLLCLPVIWFGARNITPLGRFSYLLSRMMMTVSRSVHEIVWALFLSLWLVLEHWRGLLPWHFARSASLPKCLQRPLKILTRVRLKPSRQPEPDRSRCCVTPSCPRCYRKSSA